MKSVPLTAYARSVTGRNAAKKLRDAGRIPTVIYGRKRAAQNLELNHRELDKLISHSASENILVDLTIEGEAGPQRLALVQDVQHNPLNGKVLHIDFHEVAPDEKVTIMVPVEAVGTPIGVKNGGCAGMEYTMEWAGEIGPFDEVVEDKGVRVLVDPKAVLFLLGTQMDFQTTKLSSGFVFNNPNQTSACGCGESVAITPASADESEGARA